MRLFNFFGRATPQPPAPRARLTLENLEAREVPAIFMQVVGVDGDFTIDQPVDPAAADIYLKIDGIHGESTALIGRDQVDTDSDFHRLKPADIFISNATDAPADTSNQNEIVSVGGADEGRVTKVESITVKQQATGSAGDRPADAGESPDARADAFADEGSEAAGSSKPKPPPPPPPPPPPSVGGGSVPMESLSLNYRP